MSGPQPAKLYTGMMGEYCEEALRLKFTLPLAMSQRTQFWNRDPVRATEILVSEILEDPENAYVPPLSAFQFGVVDALADYLIAVPSDLGRIVGYGRRLERDAYLRFLSQIAGTNGYGSTPELRRALFEADVVLDAEIAAAVFVPMVLLDPETVPLPPRASDARLLAMLGLVHVQKHPGDMARLGRFVQRLPVAVRSEVADRAVALGTPLPSEVPEAATPRILRGLRG